MEGIEVETVAVYDNGPAPETGGAVGEAGLDIMTYMHVLSFVGSQSQ